MKCATILAGCIAFGTVVLAACTTDVKAQDESAAGFKRLHKMYNQDPKFQPGDIVLCSHSVPEALTDKDGKITSRPTDWGDEKSEPAAIDRSAWLELKECMEASDRVGFDELRKAMRVIDVPTHIKILIIKNEIRLGLPFFQVRIKEGQYKDKLVYMPESALRNIPSGLTLTPKAEPEAIPKAEAKAQAKPKDAKKEIGPVMMGDLTNPPGVGSTVTLVRLFSRDPFLCKDYFAFMNYAEAMRAKDSLGIAELSKINRGQFGQEGTTALIVETLNQPLDQKREAKIDQKIAELSATILTLGP